MEETNKKISHLPVRTNENFKKLLAEPGSGKAAVCLDLVGRGWGFSMILLHIFCLITFIFDVSQLHFQSILLFHCFSFLANQSYTKWGRVCHHGNQENGFQFGVKESYFNPNKDILPYSNQVIVVVKLIQACNMEKTHFQRN